MTTSKDSKRGGQTVDPELLKPLKIAIDFLETRGYYYAVVGGIALSQWGIVRATRDVDFKVLVPDTDYVRVRNEIMTAFPDGARKNLPPNPLIVSVKILGVIVDFLLAVPGYEENILKRAEKKSLNGLQVWICSAEDLIIQKAIAGRGHDWPDIEALLIERHGKLEDSYIEEWLSQFAVALEQPKLLGRYRHAKQQAEDAANELP